MTGNREQFADSLSARSLLTLGLLAVATLAVMTTEMLPIGLLAQMAESLGVQEGRLGLLVSAYGAVVVVGAVPLSILVSRLPIRTAMFCTLSVFIVSISVTAASATLDTALVARIIGGVAHAVFYSCSFTMAISVVGKRWRGRAVAIIGSGNALALALGVPAATALGTWLSWPVPFWSAAVVLLVVLVMLTVTYRPLTRRTTNQTPTMRSLSNGIRSRTLACVAIVIVVVMTGHFMTYTYIVPIIGDAGAPETFISVVLVAYGLAGVAGLIVAGRYADTRPRLILRITVAITLAAIGSLWLFRGSAAGTITAITFWGFAFGAAPVLWQLMAVRAAPAAASIGPAVVNAAFNIGISLGAFSGGALLTIFQPVDLALPSLVLLTIALGLVMAPRWLPNDHDAQSTPATSTTQSSTAR